mgnify:CR=1 FL=1
MSSRMFFNLIAGMGPVDVLALSLRATGRIGGLSFHADLQRDVARSGDVSFPAGGGSLDSGEARGSAAGINHLEATCDARR